MLSARPGPLNPGAMYLLQHHPIRPSRAAGSYLGGFRTPNGTRKPYMGMVKRIAPGYEVIIGFLHAVVEDPTVESF